MTIDDSKLRLDGLYLQNDRGDLMLRIKIPAGVLSSDQARRVADLAERFTAGTVHLTSRGSIELHGVRYPDVPQILRRLASVGLTTRGACGGAVRGVSCSTTFGPGFHRAQSLARRLHRHFAGNPHFEGLPKKFKIGVDGGYEGARHLIQDVGLVFVPEGEEPHWDVWVAGGLGREPQAAFRYAEKVPEAELIPLIEAILRLYRRFAPRPKRLKSVVRTLGEADFRRLLGSERQVSGLPSQAPTVEPSLIPAERATFAEAGIFAGELAASALHRLAEVADRHAEGFLALTADQNVALPLAAPEDLPEARFDLAAAGFRGETPEEKVRFRVCPGSHECRMGLAPTRDVAGEIIAALDEKKAACSWAISGCANACSQPQLADYGIVSLKNVPGPDGERRPLFDLYRRKGEGLGEKIQTGLGLEELLQAIADA